MAGKTWQKAEYFDDGREQLALKKRFSFKNFAEALEFVNKVGILAEEAKHHPDINLGWGYVQIWLTTHDAHSITKKDYDLAAKIDDLYTS